MPSTWLKQYWYGNSVGNEAGVIVLQGFSTCVDVYFDFSQSINAIGTGPVIRVYARWFDQKILKKTLNTAALTGVANIRGVGVTGWEVSIAGAGDTGLTLGPLKIAAVAHGIEA